IRLNPHLAKTKETNTAKDVGNSAYTNAVKTFSNLSLCTRLDKPILTTFSGVLNYLASYHAKHDVVFIINHYKVSVFARRKGSFGLRNPCQPGRVDGGHRQNLVQTPAGPPDHVSYPVEQGRCATGEGTVRQVCPP